MRVLVTGGAGYIGSHMVHTLAKAGHHVVVLDNLLSGHRDAVPADVPFIEADIRDEKQVSKALSDHAIDSVLHFAARIQVGESVTDPRLYFRDNLAASIQLLETTLDSHVKRFVLSSTAAVYGTPLRTPIDEDHPTQPINPYGETKRAIERVLESYAKAYGLSYAALRYFNAAGAAPAQGLGERHDPETHLLPIVLEAAKGTRPPVTIMGDDYDTPDGTCLRDYVHVLDLADAHLSALEHLQRGGESGAFNLGTGRGHSVREVLTCVERVTKAKVPFKIGPRREGDPAVLVASPAKAKRILGFKANRSSLTQIVQDAWNWHSK